MKRIFDFTFSLAGMIILGPLLLALAILVLVLEGRPVVFSQTRVGLGGKLFPLYKFRTMRPGGGDHLVTAENDQRVTRAGRWMRRYKLDELPQLFNVLKGDMSLVGPRPEVPKFVDLFRAEYETILTVRPGVTDPASIRFRDESALLTQSGPEAENAYLEQIMPLKLKIYRDYVCNRTLPGDIRLILKTVTVIFRPS